MLKSDIKGIKIVIILKGIKLDCKIRKLVVCVCVFVLSHVKPDYFCLGELH